MAESIQDCTFFEHNGILHMGLAIQLGPQQYSPDEGIYFV